jgi:hypothetical protein
MSLPTLWALVRFGPQVVHFELAAIFGMTAVLLVDLLSPATLTILYWTDATLVLSSPLRYAALGMALLAGMDSVPQLVWLVGALQVDWRAIQEFHSATVASQISQWLPLSNAAEQFGSVLTIAGEQTLILFLLHLFRLREVPDEIRRSDLLHDVAKLSVIGTTLMLVGRVGWGIYTIASYEYYKHLRPDLVGARWQWFIRIVTTIPGAVLPLVIPFIVLKGQAPTPVEDFAPLD